MPPSYRLSHRVPGAPEMLTLTIGTLTGTFTIQVRATDAVEDVKRCIQDMEGIPVESQILLWRDKALADDRSVIGQFGIENGSKLQLLLHMSTGPGPPLKMKKVSKEYDSVVFFLCKEEEDVYMLELHMADIRDQRADTRKLLRLAELAGVEVFEDAGCDASSVVIRRLGGSDDESRRSTSNSKESGVLPTQERQLKDLRPASSESNTSTLMSFAALSSTGTLSDRGVSPFSSTSDSRPSSGESLIQDVFHDVLAWRGNRIGSRNRAFGCPRTPRRRLRPATAISVMRLPGGSGPMIIIPKTRPASAAHLRNKGTLALDDTPPLTPPNVTEREDCDRDRCDMRSILCGAPRLREKGSGRRLQSFKMDPPDEGGYLPASDNTTQRTDPSRTSAEHVLEFISAAVPGRRARAASNSTARGIHTELRSLKQNRDRLMGPGCDSAPKPGERPRSKKEAKSTVVTQRRCYMCKKKLGPATSFKCRCSQTFCSIHRYSDRHACTYDYRGAGKAALVKENPLVKKEKLAKI
ncbi:hypothetical protein SpCBS45565_g06137 [Spizellomyces sp. 'palustris']|nr:hypothetical protein SpCBS45565_g06137 [Spizellomyces sp. 'palustris']